jgi:hypothetical protein
VTDTTKFQINASSIVLSDASLTITTPHPSVFGVNPLSQGSLNLGLIYERGTSSGSEPISLLNSTFLQIWNPNLLPASDIWNFCVFGLDNENCFETGSKKV